MPVYHLEQPREHDVLCKVLTWRLGCPEVLRTTSPETEQTQRKFWDTVICNPLSAHRYWSYVDESGDMVAFVGLTAIDHVNRNAEISLIVDPTCRRQGIGTHAVEAVLHKAFYEMGLHSVYGEVYECSPYYDWWARLLTKMNVSAPPIILPDRKFWNGKFYNSRYFVFMSRIR